MSTVGIQEQPLLIGGEWTSASGGATFERVDPYTAQTVTVAAAAGRADARRACDADGNLVSPTVLANVTPDMRVYAEESFGPVVAMVPVDGVDEAVRVANDTEYGLAASVFGEDVDAALDVARRIEGSICHVNSSTVHDEPQLSRHYPI
jgi:acyl-CoA reductase-like NAD-dependent aldehyde dehydrogenase